MLGLAELPSCDFRRERRRQNPPDAQCGPRACCMPCRGTIDGPDVMGGSGLGLAICKDILEAHAGTIEAQPSTLGGLKMQVTLPLCEEKNSG